jgi:hypothetical protein
MSIFDIEDDIIDGVDLPKAVVLYKENCQKCNGTGIWSNSAGHYRNTCFSCKGVGYHEYKTARVKREKNRENAQKSKAKKEETALNTFAETNPDAYSWMVAKAPTFEFASSMLEALKKYGSLTEKQMASVNKCVESDKARQQQFAKQRTEALNNAKEVTVEAIEVAFNNAKENGIKYPKLNLDTFTFKPASETSKNFGSIYVTEEGIYLGKVFKGKFLKVRECNEDQETRIVEACIDPKASAIAYGKKYGSCSTCGRELTNGKSIELGIGPICADKYGW